MPSVADELAALRNRGLAKKEKGKLTTKGGATLSTPAEMDSKIQNNKAQIKKKDEIKASDALDLETQYFLERNKKDDVTQPLTAVAKSGGSVADAAKKLNAKPKPAGKKTAPAAATMAPPAAVSNESTNASSAASTRSGNQKVEAVDDDDDDDVPELEEQDDAGIPDLGSVPVAQTTQNRAEKKTRKMLNKIMGMQPMPDGQIVRVTFKLAQQGIFAIEQPTVYESTTSKSAKTYVVLGEAKSLNQNNQAAAAAKNFQQVASPQEQAAVEVVDDDADDDVPDLTTADQPLDETGLDGNDIDLVMSQASCSRAKAVKALKENDGDLVNTIMALTT